MKGKPVITAIAAGVMLAAIALSAAGPAVSLQAGPQHTHSAEDLIGAAEATPRTLWAAGFRAGRRDEHGLIRRRDGGKWSTSFIYHGGAGVHSIFASVSAVTDTDAWAVGESFHEPAERDSALLVHWNGKRWTKFNVHIEASEISDLYGVAAVSSTDVWAVGSYVPLGGGPSRAIALHWDGDVWSSVPLPSLPGGNSASLQSVSGCSDRNVWAAGYEGTGHGHASSAYVVHWNGTNWSRSHALSREKIVQLRSISCAPGAVWTVGFSGSNFAPLAQEFSSGQWHLIDIPVGDRIWSLSAVLSLAPGDAWLVGTDETGLSQALALHWVGKRFVHTATQNPNTQDSFGAITGFRKSVWAVGETVTNGNPRPLSERWDGVRWRLG